MELKKSLSILACLLGLVTGCGENKENVVAESAKNVLNVAKVAELSTMDSTLMTDETSFETVAATKEGLYTVNGKGEIIAALAESMDVSKDGKIYTFKLRDAKWSDGVPVTANDFVFAWKRLVDPKVAAEYSYMANIAQITNAKDILEGKKSIDELGVKAIDDKTLQVTLDKPVVFFKSLLAFPVFFPIREDFYKSKGTQYGLSPDGVLANGPYKMESWDQGGGWTVVKNDNYYDADHVNMDRINFKIIKEEQSALVAYEQGDVDFLYFTGELAGTYKDNPAYIKVPDASLSYISLNQTKPEFQNENLRKAIALAFDKELITNNILSDGSKASYWAVPQQFAKGPDDKYFNEDVSKFLPTDKSKAKEYFELAKKELGKDSFEFEYVFNDTESNKKIAEFLKSELETTLVGLKLNLKQVPFKERLALQRNGNFEMIFCGWGADYDDPMTFLDMHVKSSVYNFGRWHNEEYDKLIDECVNGDLSANAEKRWEALKKAQDMFMSTAGFVPIYQRQKAGLLRPTVKGIEFHSVGVSVTYKNVTKE